MENSTDKTIQISWLKKSKTTRKFFCGISSHKCSHDTWKWLLSTSRRTFLQKYENLFPKAYLYRRKMHFRQDHPSFSNSIFRKNFSTKIVPLHTYNVILTTPDVKEQATVREKFFGDPQLFFPKTFWTIRLHLWQHRLETLRAISKETYRFLPLPKNTAHVLRDFDNNDRCFCTQSSEEPHFFSKSLPSQNPENVFLITRQTWLTIFGQNQEKLIKSVIVLRPKTSSTHVKSVFVITSWKVWAPR